MVFSSKEKILNILIS